MSLKGNSLGVALLMAMNLFILQCLTKRVILSMMVSLKKPMKYGMNLQPAKIKKSKKDFNIHFVVVFYLNNMRIVETTNNKKKRNARSLWIGQGMLHFDLFLMGSILLLLLRVLPDLLLLQFKAMKTKKRKTQKTVECSESCDEML